MKKIILTIFILITSITLYGFFINPIGFKTTSNTIEVSNLSKSFDGFKILQLSDFLIKSSKDLDRLENINKEIKKLKPDIIIYTGDLLHKDNTLKEDDITKLKDILYNMECTLYKYAVLGDNDDITKYTDVMNIGSFIVLDNESKYIFYKDITPIKITGITNLDNLDKSITIEDNLDTTFNLVITHYPDYFDTIKNMDIDVILAGHSLKGQIRIPFYGGIVRLNDAKKYLNGYYEEKNTKMYVSSGIGNNKIDFRLFNKPEINLYILKSN